MREIGGYPALERFLGKEYHVSAKRLNLTRSALRILLVEREIKKLWVPSFLCQSVFSALKKQNLTNIVYYEIDKSFLPVLDAQPKEHEAVYIVNYYGQLDNEVLLSLKQRYQRIIVDNVQAFFQMPLPNTDTLYCCRKWFGVPDGAYLYSSVDYANLNLEVDHSSQRFAALLGRYEDGAEAHYKEFCSNESFFDQQPVLQMSTLTENLMCSIDYDMVRKRRDENFIILYKEFKKTNLLKLTVPEGAFYYPLLINDAAVIRKRLLERKIYIPILWPECKNEWAKSILPLPIDQRYNGGDMQYIIEGVRNL